MLETAIALELVLGKWVEALIFSALLIFNAILSSLEENRAQSALALLRQRMILQSRVYRDGGWTRIPARALVPGDIVHLRVGDLVPADISVEDGQLLVDQSTLTGESVPIDVEPGTTIYAGTTVKRGEATGTVTTTGARTYFGKSAELVRVAKTTNHFQRAILGMIRYLVVVDVGLAVVVLIYALIAGMALSEILPFVLVLLIASVPVALPGSSTLATALGAVELAGRGVLVPRLTAIEEAAGLDVICIDKTGTITLGQMKLDVVRAIPPHTAAELIEFAALACDEATQDPIDLAILEMKQTASTSIAYERLTFTPFDPSTKRSESRVRHDGRILQVMKGAPPVILELVGVSAGPVWNDAQDLAAQGFRVLAVAAGQAEPLELYGFLGFRDPPRPDSISLIRDLRHLQVRVLMVTGDGPATAKAVARQVGIGNRACEREQIVKSAADLSETCDVFAGVFPEDKFALIKSLQQSGHVVGMTGDGVNDAPALRQADVGIAVANATDVAKAAASLVSTSSGLGDIVEAVKTSRRIFQRVQTYTLNMLIKKLELPLLLTLGVLLTGTFVTSPRLMVLLIFTNDIATMAITTDRVLFTHTPDRWSPRPLVLTALALAFPLLILSLSVFAIGRTLLDFRTPQLQTFVFLWLVISCQATIYLVRERRHFWSSRPSRWLLLSTTADIVVVSVLATRGWLMVSIPVGGVAMLLVLGLLYLVVMEPIKTVVFHHLELT